MGWGDAGLIRFKYCIKLWFSSKITFAMKQMYSNIRCHSHCTYLISSECKGKNVDNSTSLCLTKPPQTPGKHALWQYNNFFVVYFTFYFCFGLFCFLLLRTMLWLWPCNITPINRSRFRFRGNTFFPMMEEVGQPCQLSWEVGKAVAAVINVAHPELKHTNLLSVSLPSLIRVSFLSTS